jgi:hypothetical protein
VSLDWCWERFSKVKLPKTERQWVICELAKWVKKDDGAPELLTAIKP